MSTCLRLTVSFGAALLLGCPQSMTSVRALTVDGGSLALALDAGTIYGFATEGCYFYALTASGDL